VNFAQSAMTKAEEEKRSGGLGENQITMKTSGTTGGSGEEKKMGVSL